MIPSISIIIPTYNSEAYLSKCIESALGQSIENIEVIVVDDGSTDNSRAIIEKFATSDSRVKPIFQENSGVSASRNVGISFSKGEYLTFLDSDDWVDSKMYEELYEAAKEYNLDVVFSGIMCEYSDRGKNHSLNVPNLPETPLNREDIKKYILPDFLNSGRVGNPIKMYKKDFIKENNLSFPTDRSLGEDFLFNMEVFTYCNSTMFINKPYYHYRQTGSGSLMKKYRPELYDLYFNHSPLEYYFKKWDLYTEEVALELANRKCFIAANGCIQNEFKKDCRNNMNAKFEVISKVVNHPDIQRDSRLLLKQEKSTSKKIYLSMLKNKRVLSLFCMGKLLSLRP